MIPISEERRSVPWPLALGVVSVLVAGVAWRRFLKTLEQAMLDRNILHPRLLISYNFWGFSCGSRLSLHCPYIPSFLVWWSFVHYQYWLFDHTFLHPVLYSKHLPASWCFSIIYILL